MKNRLDKSQLRTINLSWLFLFYFFTVPLLHAQQNATIKNDFTLKNGVKGNANYSYTIIKNDTIPDGNFEFYTSQLDSNDERYILTTLWEGTYAKAEKKGSWKYASLRLREDDGEQVKGYYIKKQARGVEYSVTGNFIEGKATGTWLALRQNIKNSSPADTTYFAKAHFENQKFAKELSAATPLKKIIGNFDEKGLLNGTWQLEYHDAEKKIIENREYSQGILKAHYFVIKKDTLKIVHKGLAAEADNQQVEQELKWVELPVGSRYFDLILHSIVNIESKNQKISIDSVQSFIKNGNDFFEKTLLSFTKHEGVELWNILKSSSKIELPSFKVIHYELSQEDQKNIKEIVDYYRKATTRFKDFQGNAQAKLAKHSNEELNKLDQILQVYHKEISKWQNLVDVISSESFEYLNRKELLSEICPEIQFPAGVQTDSNAYELPFTRIEADFKQKCNLESLKNLMANLDKDQAQVHSQAMKIVERFAKQNSLSDKEKLLVKKHDSIVSLFENANNLDNYNNYHAELKTSTIKAVDNLLSNYGRKSLEQKIEILDDELKCLENYLSLYDFLSGLGNELKKMDELYTRTVWNPFTFTEMDERVKERVYRVFIQDLFPYYNQLLKDKNECKYIEDNIEKFKQMLVRMTQLRENDTKELERQIRKSRNINELLDAFDLITE